MTELEKHLNKLDEAYTIIGKAFYKARENPDIILRMRHVRYEAQRALTILEAPDG